MSRDYRKVWSRGNRKIQENIKFLQDNGILIAIDDFGVEYSNLDLLKKIDSNIIKLDKFLQMELMIQK